MTGPPRVSAAGCHANQVSTAVTDLRARTAFAYRLRRWSVAVTASSAPATVIVAPNPRPSVSRVFAIAQAGMCLPRTQWSAPVPAHFPVKRVTNRLHAAKAQALVRRESVGAGRGRERAEPAVWIRRTSFKWMPAIVVSAASAVAKTSSVVTASAFHPTSSRRTRTIVARAVQPATPIKCVAGGGASSRSRIRTAQPPVATQPVSVPRRTVRRRAAERMTSASMARVNRRRSSAAIHAARRDRSVTAEFARAI